MGLRLAACFDDEKALFVMDISPVNLLAEIDINSASFERTAERHGICMTRDQYSQYSCEPTSQLVYVYHSGRFHVILKSVR
jgi:hypothetical protein